MNCQVCNTPIPTSSTRCTNRLCLACHRKYCTPGGATSPGHNLNLTAAQETHRNIHPNGGHDR